MVFPCLLTSSSACDTVVWFGMCVVWCMCGLVCVWSGVCVVCSAADEAAKWYKFDDGEVTECKMEDDEEMKSQCFGGDYVGEVFDHMLKRFVSLT